MRGKRRDDTAARAGHWAAGLWSTATLQRRFNQGARFELAPGAHCTRLTDSQNVSTYMYIFKFQIDL
jgi:hypothetical protein